MCFIEHGRGWLERPTGDEIGAESDQARPDGSKRPELQVASPRSPAHFSGHIGLREQRIDRISQGDRIAGLRGNDPFGPRRGGADKGRSVNNSSLSALSAGLSASAEEGLDVGDRVRVRLVRTNPERGFIDFERL